MPNPLLIQENVPLAPLTTLGIGGAARFFAEVQSEIDLIEAIAFAEQQQLPVFILGGGSNVLVADEGFSGLVIRIAIKGIEWREDVTAGAGEDWDAFVGQCIERNMAGIECLSGIPGLVGGTPVQNVGAYGQEVSETITNVRAFDRQSKQIVELTNADCQFSYRRSIFNSTELGHYIVLAVTYRLRQHGVPAIRYPDLKNFFSDRSEKPTLAEVRNAVIEIRSRKGMVIVPDDPDCRSAGSFFKNPIVSREVLAQLEREAGEVPPSFPAADGNVKVPAAWLIERAGFQRGYAKGRAGISSKHTLAIINRGGATADEVLGLVSEISLGVGERFGIELLPEPVFVGFNS
ncbi:MAG: UDP-N-acetylmuramate dehydrogenase [Acidobacteriota bacterium]|nr:UDP-N-acetylmuramate dehydrogenase [Acidobacteriota bacterium]